MKKIVAFVFTVVALFSFSFMVKTALTQSGEVDSSVAPPDYQPIPVDPTDTTGTDASILATPKVALFIDTWPWGSNAIQTILNGIAPGYTIYNSLSMQTAPLSDYCLIIIAEDQNQNFYNNLAAAMPLFTNYVSNGGVLEFHGSGWGWAGGSPAAVVLPAGVQVVQSYAWDNFVINNAGPAAGLPYGAFSGTYASHGYFVNVPTTATTHIIEGNIPNPPAVKPTMIQYPYGSGLVVAGNQTFSFGYMYGQAAGLLLQPMISYSYAQAQSRCKQYSYSVKFVCGNQNKTDLYSNSVGRGLYTTEINIHNFSDDTTISVNKYVLPLVLNGQASGREPNFSPRTAQDYIQLPPHTATMDDCYRLAQLLFGTPPTTLATMPLAIGFLEIVSSKPLNIDAVYTSADPLMRSLSIDVERIEPQIK